MPTTEQLPALGTLATIYLILAIQLSLPLDGDA
jgi:hypothetical protein